ncbi:motility protein A [Candidatus Latescibacterota bacterium]
MDLASVVGIVCAVGFVLMGIMAGGSLLQFFDMKSVLIVVGGTIGATMINYPLGSFLGAVKVARKAFFHTEESPMGIIEILVGFAETARREGILSLEQKAEALEDKFLKTGITLAVDGTEPEHIRDIMTTEINFIAERHKANAGIFEAMGMLCPAFGMIGTLIGLVNMLAGMSDPSSIGPAMAVALITTLYGAFLANVLFLPIAGKLKIRSANEILVKELCVEGIMSIQSGDNPRIVEDKLKAYISPSLRVPTGEGE